MKISITENQFIKLKKYLLSEEEKILYLDKKIDFSKLNTIDEIKDAIKIVGLQHSKGTLSRSLPGDIEVLFKLLDEVTDKKKFEYYFRILTNLMSKYKSGSFSLKKLKELLQSLLFLGVNELGEQIDQTIEIFSDPRFSEKNKKDLIKLLIGTGVTDFSNFFNTTIKKYREYEVSFLEGEDTPFIPFFTSPRIRVLLIKDYSFGDEVISKDEFNSQPSDVGRAAYLIKKISEIKAYRPIEVLLEEIISNLKFGIQFQYTEKNVKADLTQTQNLISFNSKLMRTNIVGRAGQFVEIKNNNYKTPYYLSEFFKVDATSDAEKYLIDLMSKVPKVYDPKVTFSYFMALLAENFRKTLLTNGEGQKIIDHLTANLSGMIFSNDIFIQKKDISFYWNTVGYAKKPRISIFYEVSDNADVYKIEKNQSGYTNRLKQINP
jgi:hypothetical protein